LALDPALSGPTMITFFDDDSFNDKDSKNTNDLPVGHKFPGVPEGSGTSEGDRGGTGHAGYPRNLVSLGTLLRELREDLYHGKPPAEFAVSDKPWGTFAYRPGDVLVIAAPPGMGKTAFVLQTIVDALRLNEEAKCLMVNVEMSPKVLIERQISRLSAVDLGDITARRDLLVRMKQIDPALATLASIEDRLFFMGSRYTMESVLDCIAAVEPAIVVLDYLQRIECCDGVADTRQRLNMLISQARGIAEAGISVVLVSAVGRTSSKKNGGYNGKELGLASFRESSEIEYGVDDAFVMVGFGGEAMPDGRKIIELRHVKSRNHRPVSLKFEFDGAIQQFKFLGELTDDDADDERGGGEYRGGKLSGNEELPKGDGKPMDFQIDTFANDYLMGGDA
jgi:replicative DNA helicase